MLSKFADWLAYPENKTTITEKIEDFKRFLNESDKKTVLEKLSELDGKETYEQFKRLSEDDKKTYFKLIDLVLPLNPLPKSKGTVKEKGKARTSAPQWGISKKHINEFERIFSKSSRGDAGYAYSFAKSRFKPISTMGEGDIVPFYDDTERTFDVCIEPWDGAAHAVRAKSLTEEALCKKKNTMIFEKLLPFTRPADFVTAVVSYITPKAISDYWLNMSTKKMCSMDDNMDDVETFVIRNGDKYITIGYKKGTKLENKLKDLYDYSKVEHETNINTQISDSETSDSEDE